MKRVKTTLFTLILFSMLLISTPSSAETGSEATTDTFIKSTVSYLNVDHGMLKTDMPNIDPKMLLTGNTNIDPGILTTP